MFIFKSHSFSQALVGSNCIVWCLVVGRALELFANDDVSHNRLVEDAKHDEDPGQNRFQAQSARIQWKRVRKLILLFVFVADKDEK